MDYGAAAEARRAEAYGPSENIGEYSAEDLAHGAVSLKVIDSIPANPAEGAPPKMLLDIFAGGNRVGGAHLRLGYSPPYYIAGQMGYWIDEPYRGNGYAAMACLACVPVLRARGFRRIVISADESNAASRRVCDRIGARFIETIDTPEWIGLYEEGQRRTSIYEWEFGRRDISP